MLVLGMTSVASAGIVDVVVVGEGSMGHAGTSTDPLMPSETIEIAIVLNSNPYPGTAYPNYDGYLLSTLDVDLHVSGPGTMDVGTTNKSGDPVWQYDTRLSPFGVVDDGDLSNGLNQIAGTALTPVGPPTSGSTGPIPLVWDLIIHCDGNGPLTIDLTMNGVSEYSPYSDGTGINPYPDGWILLTEGDLGDLVIHQIPEPMTIALLGLGGLFLRRRR